MERSERVGSGGMPRSYTHVGGDTAENQRVWLYGVSERESSLQIYEAWSNIKYKYKNREFWCKGYYVDTVGKNTKKIKEYIQHQLEEDAASEQLTLDMSDLFTGSK